MGLSYSKATEGVAVLCDPYGTSVEVKTVSCGHCQKIMHVSPFGDGTSDFQLPRGSENVIEPKKQEPPAVCLQCFTLVCPQCHADGRCIPLIKRLEEAEASRNFLRSAGF